MSIPANREKSYYQKKNFTIVKEICEIDEVGGARTLLALISWYDKIPQFDLRRWNGGYPFKGVTMSAQALIKLRDELNKLDLDELSREYRLLSEHRVIDPDEV